jgi:hypothetical protein
MKRKKSIRLRKIEHAARHLTRNYYEKWVAFVESNCAKCQYAAFTNKEFGYDKHTRAYPTKCLYWNKVLKPLIKMHVCLGIGCGYFLPNHELQPNIIVKTDNFSLLL